MFDFGWQEFMMIAFVLVLVVGPKDLPKVLRGFTKLPVKPVKWQENSPGVLKM